MSAILCTTLSSLWHRQGCAHTSRRFVSSSKDGSEVDAGKHVDNVEDDGEDEAEKDVEGETRVIRSDGFRSVWSLDDGQGLPTPTTPGVAFVLR